MSIETTIVLCAGPINYSYLPIGTNQSNAMIPVNGKPVIAWILDDLLAKGIRHVIVVLRKQDDRLQGFLRWAYANRMDLQVGKVDHEGSIVESLNAGLSCSFNDGGLVRIVLGDTLITDPFEGDTDFVYVGNVDDSRRWCLAVTSSGGFVKDYVDKQEAVNASYPALTGYYHLCDGAYVRESVACAISAGEHELSNVLRRYSAVHPIKAKPVQQWYDFGHIDKLVDARRRLLQPRSFNSLSIHPVLNTITKVSEHDSKLQDELDWYLKIPDELKVLTPRIVNHQQVNGYLEIVQEYYGYPTLGELYVYGDLHSDTWLSILHQVMRIHLEFRRFDAVLEPDAVLEMYLEKTRERLQLWRTQDAAWQRLLDLDEIVHNGQRLRNVAALDGPVRKKVQALSDSAVPSVIHGDFCFSNILFDVNNQIIRLIDPRGRFGRAGIYGDARYDVAKLRHSVCGLYDFILADLFELEETAAGFSTGVYVNGLPREVGSALDEMICGAGYDLNEIRLIEGLLFLSMLPLHHAHPRRQKMMFLTGLSRLNEVISCESPSIWTVPSAL